MKDDTTGCKGKRRRKEIEGKGQGTMCFTLRQANERSLYITSACANVWKGTRQLVYELIVLSFSLSLSPSPKLCGLSPPHSVLASLFRTVFP